MNDLTNDFTRPFLPKSALVVYQKKTHSIETYVEFFDMDKSGNPINAHPLTVNEAKKLINALNVGQEKNNSFLMPHGVLKSNILFTDQIKGKVMWFTKGQQRELFFQHSTGIPNGIANVPPMLWFADTGSISVFALGSDRRPANNSKLYFAPFFNIYENGKVCMGTVDVEIKNSASLDEFTEAWEKYFFHSYFSHFLDGHNPVKGNCALLWEDLIKSGKSFPMEVLRTNKKTIKDLIP